MDELLTITDLHVEYRAGDETARAVNGLNLTIRKGEAVGLVGESGAGKTTTALSILNLLPERVGRVTRGEIRFNGESLLGLSEQKMSEIRGGRISMVFANPLTSLNPVFPVGHQIAMGLRKHRNMGEREAAEEAAKLLKLVGIAAYRIHDYPHQFSGGMRQRVGIAAALACSPDLLIADEPTTALDVTIQAQILELMKKLQRERASSLLMITHNLGIIAELCQKVAIMYSGEIVEFGTVREVFGSPRHSYTKGLLHAIPKLKGERERLTSIPGNVANAMALPDGCRFHPRCANRSETCSRERPEWIRINDDHFVACHRCALEGRP